jgi:hypothetical protein
MPTTFFSALAKFLWDGCGVHWSHLLGILFYSTLGTMDAVKVHRPRDWASRGDDFAILMAPFAKC